MSDTQAWFLAFGALYILGWVLDIITIRLIWKWWQRRKAKRNAPPVYGRQPK